MKKIFAVIILSLVCSTMFGGNNVETFGGIEWNLESANEYEAVYTYSINSPADNEKVFECIKYYKQYEKKPKYDYEFFLASLRKALNIYCDCQIGGYEIEIAVNDDTNIAELTYTNIKAKKEFEAKEEAIKAERRRQIMQQAKMDRLRREMAENPLPRIDSAVLYGNGDGLARKAPTVKNETVNTDWYSWSE